MGRLSASLLALALGVAAAVALAACGSSGGADLLPGATASQINSNIDQVQTLVGEGECIGAENAAAAVGQQVEELTGVDKKLKQALSEGATRLNEVVAECEETGPSEAEEREAEEAEALEAAENEEAEKHEKSEKEKKKPKKEAKEPKEEKEPPVEPEPPAQEEGGETPPFEPGGGTGSGGVGPGTPAGAE